MWKVHYTLYLQCYSQREKKFLDIAKKNLYISTVQLEKYMSSVYTYTQARENLAGILDNVVENNEIVIVKRRNAENAAIISEAELNSLIETAHLLRSPKNAARLYAALNDIKADLIPTQTLEELKKELGLE